MNKIKMSFYPKGGLGDYIVSLKVLDYIMSLEECEVDIFCEHLEFGKAIFGQRNNVRVHEVMNEVEYNTYWNTLRQYDIALISEVFIEINHADNQKLMVEAPKLYHFWAEHQANYHKVRPDIEEYMYCLENYIRKCEISGKDRWTAFLNEGIEIKDHFSGVYLRKEFQNAALKIVGKEQYMTVNYGADMTGLSGIQTKVWPMEYFEELVERLKKKHPDIKIIQIGAKKNQRIQGVDKCILGESLEITKWVLKMSLLHIDSEGGLVHLATQLGTKCAVIFGPTPAHFYAYDQNINILPLKCGNCMGTSRNWYVNCLKRQKYPECMYNTIPQIVYEKVEDFLSTKELKKLVIFDLDYKKIFDSANDLCRIAVLGIDDYKLPVILEKKGFDVTVYVDNRGNEECEYLWKENLSGNNVEYRTTSYYSYPCLNDTYDIVFENRKKHEGLQDDISRILKVGGYYIHGENVYKNEVIK